MSRMKKSLSAFIAIFICSLALSCRSGKPDTFVFDEEHDLTSLQVRQLDSLYRAHEQKTTNEIVLVTTVGTGTDSSLASFATDFGNRHGIGKKDKDNGVVIAFSRQRHQIFIATGKGTEQVIRDEEAKRIIYGAMIPYFKNGRTFEGLWEGSLALVGRLEQPENQIR